MVLSLAVSETAFVFAMKVMTARRADHGVLLLRLVVVQWLLRLAWFPRLHLHLTKDGVTGFVGFELDHFIPLGRGS